MADRKKIAAVITSYFPRSHADVIVTKFLKGFPTDDGLLAPEVDVVSMYLDQVHFGDDIGCAIAEEYGVPMFGSINQALTLGGDKLAVDGVLLIGEHGIIRGMRRSNTCIRASIFLSRFAGCSLRRGGLCRCLAISIFRIIGTMQSGCAIALGNSMCRLWRGRLFRLHGASRGLSMSWDTEIETAMSVAFGGLDSYGFHALETLQCMVERRVGGETGIVAVQCLEGDEVWASDAWDRDCSRRR